MIYGQPETISVPTVLTERLILRCWRPSDIDPYAAMNADEETMRWLNGTASRTSTESIVIHLAGMWIMLGYGMWAVEDRESGEFLGRAGTYYADGWPGIEVAVSIRRDRWGQGLGSEAIRAALDFGFDHLEVDELITATHQRNVGMNAIARKLGMVFREVADMGPWRASNVYAMSRAAWRGGASPG
jgi:RimJ/RimL family protein N-acetyltransferase